jgi:hypothetical protein
MAGGEKGYTCCSCEVGVSYVGRIATKMKLAKDVSV